MGSRLADRVETRARVTSFSDEHDRLYSALDFAGLIALWNVDDPTPVYIGDEYAEPVVGGDALRSHFGRLASRVREASMSSDIVETFALSADVVRCVRYTRWAITPREREAAQTGECWTTWILTDGDDGLRIVHHSETAAYDSDEPTA